MRNATKEEIIERLERIADNAVHAVGEKPFIMSLDDGIAVHEAIEIIKKTNVTEVLQEIRQEIEQEKDGYPPSADEYMAINRVLTIVDKHISVLNNDQFERIWQNTVKEMKRRKIGE